MAIVIIADDLSGAAELAGIAFAHGLSAEVQREFDPSTSAAVIAVDTDSRALPAHEAALRVEESARAVVASRPEWIFKKTDSVLRGNVSAEIDAILRAGGFAQALLIPANPSRGRTIEQGRYLIGGVPLDQTDFARDPEHPRRSAQIAELLDGDEPQSRIATPDVTTLDDLRRHAAQLDELTLAAGAADYFTAVLKARTKAPPAARPAVNVRVELPALLVCGSRNAWPQRAGNCAAAHIPVRTFPPLFEAESVSAADMPACAALASKRLESAGKLLVGIGEVQSAAPPAELHSRLAELTAQILHQTPVATLLAEGGATAAALARRMNWTRMAVAARAPAGVGVLRPIACPPAPLLLIKPGSYPWPEAIWHQVAAPR